MVSSFRSLGVNFGGDAGQTFGDGADAKRFDWGVSFAWMGGGVFGFEGDIGYSPDFYGKTDVGGSSVLSLMGNVLVGVPFGGQQGSGFARLAWSASGRSAPTWSRSTSWSASTTPRSPGTSVAA